MVITFTDIILVLINSFIEFFMTFFRYFIFLNLFTFYLPFTNAEENTPPTEMTDKAGISEQAKDEKNKDKANTDKSSESETKKRLIQPVKALQKLHNEDLKHYSNNAESLLVGVDEYITINKSSNTANSKGTIILIPDWQQPATTPRALNHIQTAMPDHGWATITVQPMDKPKNYPSIAIDEKISSEENEKTREEHQKKLAAIYRAIMAKIINMPGIFILVSEGNHAGMLISLLADETEQPHAFIMLSSYSVIPENNKKTAKDVAYSDLPILDLYLKKDNNQVKPAAVLRKQQTNQEMKADYRQRQLNNFNTGYYPKELLIKEVKGWLKSIGW